MAWWLWLIIGIVGWTVGAWGTTFLWILTSPKYERNFSNGYSKEDANTATWAFFFWPFFLVALPIVNGQRLFYAVLKNAGMKADAVATKIERKAELRRLREMHEVKEEETYPIPHEVSEAQWRQAQGMRNQYMPNNHLRSLPGETFHQWVQRVHGDKNES